MADTQDIQTVPFQQTPISDAAPVQPALPTLNPSDSPYQPLNLPQVEPKQVALPEQQPVQNLGATSKAGGIAYIADQILRGAMKGYDAAQQQKAQAFNTKLQSLDSIYNEQAKRVHDIAAAGRAGTFTPGPDGKPVFVPSDEFKEAQARANTVWKAMYDTIGQRIPQPKKSAKSQQGQQNGTDQTTLIQAALNHKNDPQGALQAIYLGAGKIGPPINHQIAGFLTPEYIAKQQQGAQIQATQAQGQQSSADLALKKTQLENSLLDAQTKGDTAAADRAKQALSDLQEAASPYHRPNSEENKRADYQALLSSGNVPKDAQGNPLSYEAWGAYSSSQGRSAGAPPKPFQYDPKTDQVVDYKTGKRWSVGEKDMPVEVASVFKGANSATFEKQQRALQLLNAHTDASLRSHAVQVDDPSNPGQVIYMPAGTAMNTGAHAPASGEHKAALQEGTGLVKQELDAKNQFNSVATNLRMMSRTADAAKKGNGAAQTGVISAYLKSVVGGQGTGVRITKPEWDAAVKTRPWLAGIQATFSPAGIMTGAAIAPQQVDQMVEEVHQKAKALHDSYLQAQKDAHPAKASTAAPSTSPQTHVFDSAAWKTANPNGDVEAAKAAAKAQGYEVK